MRRPQASPAGRARYCTVPRGRLVGGRRSGEPRGGLGSRDAPGNFRRRFSRFRKKRWGRDLASGFQPVSGRSNPTFSSLLSLLVGSFLAAASVSSHRELRQPSRESDAGLSTAANYLRGGRSTRPSSAHNIRESFERRRTWWAREEASRAGLSCRHSEGAWCVCSSFASPFRLAGAMQCSWGSSWEPL